MSRQTLLKLIGSLLLLAVATAVLVADSTAPDPPHMTECDGVDYDREYDYELTCTQNDSEYSYDGTAPVYLQAKSDRYESTEHSIESGRDDLSFAIRGASDYDRECPDRDGQRHYMSFMVSADIEDDGEFEAELQCDEIFTERGRDQDDVAVDTPQTVDCLPGDYSRAGDEEPELDCRLTMTELD